MITMEMVEKLRKYGDLTYEDAKSALEAANGDMLEAVISLEKQGKIKPPENNGSYTARNEKKTTDEERKTNSSYEEVSFVVYLKKFVNWCGKLLKSGNRNTLEVKRNGELIISVPVTILVIFTICAFWVVVPLLVLGLFCNYRYLFRGPDLGKDSVNNVVESVTNCVNDIKEAANENKQGKDSDN